MELELRARAHRDGPDRGSVGRGDVARAGIRSRWSPRIRITRARFGVAASAPTGRRETASPSFASPFVIGHRTTAARIMEEATYAVSAGGRRSARLGSGRGRGGLAVVPGPVSGAGERPPSTIPLDPLARGHPARCRRHDRADARRARAPHGPAPGAVQSIAPRTGSS